MIESRTGNEPMHLMLNEEEILSIPNSIKPWILYIGQICDNNVYFTFCFIF